MGKEKACIELPNDVIMLILLELPVKSLLRFKSCCKLWFSWTIDRDFVQQHHSNQRNKAPQIVFAPHQGSHVLESMVRGRHHRSMSITTMIPTLPKDRYNLLHSCDGILLFKGDHSIFVLNPITREFRIVPNQCHTPNDIVFGRDEVTKELKIVRSFFLWEPEFEVLTLNSDPQMSWRCIGITPKFVRKANVYGGHKPPPVCVKGAIHWLSFEPTRKPIKNKIISFDVHTEKFRTTCNLSGLSLCSENPILTLIPLRNSVCLVENTHNNIRMYMNDGNNWDLLYHIGLESLNRDIGFSFAEEDELLAISIRDNAYWIQIDNPNTKTVTNAKRYYKNGYQCKAYIESLLPLTCD